MIGSWSNRIIKESRCHIQDRHALDTTNQDANYVALGLVLERPEGNGVKLRWDRQRPELDHGERGEQARLGVLRVLYRPPERLVSRA